MNGTTIEYSIDYEKYLKSVFPFKDRQCMLNEILNGMEVKNLICTITGHDEEAEGSEHQVDSKQIVIPGSEECVFLEDERIITGLKRLVLICEEHYISRDDNQLPKQGIDWKVTIS